MGEKDGGDKKDGAVVKAGGNEEEKVNGPN